MIVDKDPIFLSVNFTGHELGFIAGLIVSEYKQFGDQADEPVFTLAYKIKDGLKKRTFPKETKEMIDIICDDLGKVNE